MTFKGDNKQLANALRETANRLGGQKACICLEAAKRLEEADSIRTAVEAAIREMGDDFRKTSFFMSNRIPL